MKLSDSWHEFLIENQQDNEHFTAKFITRATTNSTTILYKDIIAFYLK